MKISFYKLFILSIAIGSSVIASALGNVLETNNPSGSNTATAPSPSALNTAKQAFDKKDFSSALSLYQTAMKNHVPQVNVQVTPIQTPSLTNKIISYFTGSSSAPINNPNSKNLLNGYICLQMGNCYTELNQPSKAVSVYDFGASVGGDNDMGNACLFEKGFCQMKQKDYADAYQSLKEYVRRNIDKNPAQMDQTRIKRAAYMASVCFWKLSKSGTTFESDMTGAKALAAKAYVLLPALDNRIYFKK